jgi:hypothetical protein
MLFLLSCMYDLTELFDDEGNHEILCRLCDYVIRLSAIYIENTHLFKQTVISFRDIPRGDRAESASRGLDYLHAKGKLRPWMTSWMEVFDSQDDPIPGMRCSVRSWERYTLKNEVECVIASLSNSAGTKHPLPPYYPPKFVERHVQRFQRRYVAISRNYYIALNQDRSRGSR